MWKVCEKKGWYRISVPEDWVLELDQSPELIHSPEIVGAIQITTQSPRPLKPGEKIDTELFLEGFLRSIGIENADVKAYKLKALDSSYYEYTEESDDRVFWRIWAITNNDVLLFVTYNCVQEDRDIEYDTVARIIESIELL